MDAPTASGSVRVTAGASQAIASLARHSAVRFLVVGVLSIAADAGLLALLHGVLRIWLPVATALAFAGAFVVNFGLNRGWAFGSSASMGRQLRRYLLLVAANLALTVVFVSGLTWLGLMYLIAKLITAAVLAAANYVISRRWIFI